MNGEPESRLKGVDRVLAALTWIAAGALVVMLFAGPILIAEDEPATPDPEPAAAEQDSSDPATDGEGLFAENCGSCHTLSAAGTSGSIGPDLDDAGLDAEQVTSIVSEGSGSMPSFSSELDGAEIDAIAQFVAASSGG